MVFHDLSCLLSGSYDVSEAVFNLDNGYAFPSGRPLYSLNVPAGKNFLDKLRQFFIRIKRLRTLKGKLQTRLCISHLEGADFVNILSARGEKRILCIHGSRHDGLGVGVFGWARRRVLTTLLYNRADRIVTVSRDINQELENLGVNSEKIQTINNSFDLQKIRLMAADGLTSDEQSIFDGMPVMVTSGRLASQKNQKPLLEIFQLLTIRLPVKLVIIGDGELRDALLAHAKKLGLNYYEPWSGMPLHSDYQLYFLGFQDNPHKFIARSQVFLLTSAFEGFPMVLGEALTCHLPIVSVDCPTGPREMLAPESGARPEPPIRTVECGPYGMLAPPLNNSATLSESVSVWVDAMEALLKDKMRQQVMGEASSRRAEDFSREKVAGQWLELVEQVFSTP